MKLAFYRPMFTIIVLVTQSKRKKCSSYSNADWASGSAKKQYRRAYGEAGHTCALAVGATLNQNAAQPQPKPKLQPCQKYKDRSTGSKSEAGIKPTINI